VDWDGVIEKNRVALKRVVAALLAMARLGGSTSPLVGEDGSARRGEAEALAEPGEGYFSGSRHTLPRHLYRAVLRLLRPAEAAARRLVIVCARDVVVALPPVRPRKPKPKSLAPVLRSLGIAVVFSPAEAARAASARSARAPRKQIALPLLDPLRVPRPGRPRYAPAHAAPRILFPGVATPRRLSPPPSPDDPIDATHLTLRLGALAAALDDLPKHARRFARWRMRRDRTLAAGRFLRLTPLRPGRPPGLSAANRRWPAHEVHEILADMQHFAVQAMRPPDTS
jgi:hypothetical protein